MKTLIFGCCVLTLGISLQSTAAEQVFESIDDKGNVTFSDSIPPGAVVAEPIAVDADPPTQAEVEASRKRAEQEIKAADEGQQQRDRANERQRAAEAAAQRRVEAAEAKLAEAKEFREGDRQGMAGGGSRIKPEYFQRVEAAEQELKEAQEAAKQLAR